MAAGREQRDTLLRGTPPPEAVLRAIGPRSSLPGAVPRPVTGAGHSVPLSTGMLENGWVQPWAGWMRTLCPGRCPPLPVPARGPAAAHCPRQPWSHSGGSPTYGVTSLLAAGPPLLLALCPLPAPFSISGRLSGWPGAAAAELQGWWLQDQRALSCCRGQLDTGPWWGIRSSLVLPHSRQEEEGRGRGLDAGAQGGPNPAAVQGPMGPGPYSCAVQSSPAPAWPSRVLAAGKGAGISAFGGYFQVLERSRGEMRLSPRRPEKQGPALGNGGLQGEGREGLSTTPRAHISAPPLGPMDLPKHPAFTHHMRGTEP